MGFLEASSTISIQKKNICVIIADAHINKAIAESQQVSPIEKKKKFK